ncbi:MAG: ABC transporter permease [Heliobacteriaceae bacterium]|nr:ABC transporter permease [Heliobacteriaceae bacterium]
MEKIILLTLEHLGLSTIGVLFGIAVGLPLGIMITRRRKLAGLVVGTTEMLQTIPSLAMLALLMMWLGLGNSTLIIALFLYSLLPIVRNTYTGLVNVDTGLIEAGRGMGMTRLQVLRLVQLPLALPVILAGIRVALITAIGVATIGTLIGAGGLGELIWLGMKNIETSKGVNMLFSGAIPAALLAIACELGLERLEKALTPRGLRVSPESMKN